MLVDKLRGDHFQIFKKIYKLSQNSDLQYIQESIASMVISTQSIQTSERYKQMLQLYKRSSSASELDTSDMMHDMIQKQKQKKETKAKSLNYSK